LSNEKLINKVICGDALEILDEIAQDSIDLVLTDPPYFLDKLDDGWNPQNIQKYTFGQVVTSLPAGMKFDREQGRRFYAWFFRVSQKIFRVLKPGGFFFSFSSPRLYHRMVSAADDAGFLIRDCFIWLYTQNQPKAMSLNHFIDRLSVSREQKEQIKRKLLGWKTPQVKCCFEPIMMAQKPCDGTFLENVLKHNVGLINTGVTIGNGMFPSNVVTVEQINEIVDKCFLLPKPSKKEKGDYNIHISVKPLALCEYIISLTTFSEEAVVLDPFVGSGTTVIAAKRLQRRFIAIDINPEYVEIARKRLQEIEQRNESSTNYGRAHQLPLLAEGQRNGAKKKWHGRLQRS